MKKIICLLLLASFTITGANAQGQERAQNDSVTNAEVLQPEAAASQVEGPEAQFEKLVHDYGQIALGADGNCEFKFKNIGSEPLVVANVQTSCGCTAPSWSREPIMPGEEGSIKVHYDTKRPGHIGKSITVYTNGKTDRIVLRITGNVNVNNLGTEN